MSRGSWRAIAPGVVLLVLAFPALVGWLHAQTTLAEPGSLKDGGLGITFAGLGALLYGALKAAEVWAKLKGGGGPAATVSVGVAGGDQATQYLRDRDLGHLLTGLTEMHKDISRIANAAERLVDGNSAILTALDAHDRHVELIVDDIVTRVRGDES